MNRGDIHIFALPGDYGKPRPVVIVQHEQSITLTQSVTFCMMTSKLIRGSLLRIDIEPSDTNGITRPSQIQADKLQSVRKDRMTNPIGRLDAKTLANLDLALAFHLGLYALQ